MTATTDIAERLRQEFRVRDWWPGMDSFDSARGETVPHPLAKEAAAEIEALRAWKAEAIEVIGQWEKVWDALGRPGRLGESKAAAVLRFIQATRGPGINYDGPEPSVECAWPPCKNRLRRVGPPSMSGADHPQWCSKGHRALSETEPNGIGGTR